MSTGLQNAVEGEDPFDDRFVPIFSSSNRGISNGGSTRPIISTSSINESTIPECLGGKPKETLVPDSTVAMKHSHNFLKVNKKEVNTGEDIHVSWNVTETCSANDWIGIFKAEDVDPRRFLDHRQRGVHGVREGKLVWSIRDDCVTGPETTVCFRYFRANGKMAATSENFTILKPSSTTAIATAIATIPIGGENLLEVEGLEDFSLSGILSNGDVPSLDSAQYIVTISDVSAAGLRGSILGPPSPYVKLTVLQHKMATSEPVPANRKRTECCTSTYNPTWTSEVRFQVSPSDSIELEIRDKFEGSSPSQSHFLGKTELWIQDFLDFDFTCTHTLELYKRIPSDNVEGTATFTIKVSKDLLSSTGLAPPPADTQTAPTSPLDNFAGEENGESGGSGGGSRFKMKFVPLNDQCANSDLERDLTPSPIHFCEDSSSYIRNFASDSSRNQREWSMGSQVSIQTLESIEGLPDASSLSDLMMTDLKSPSPSFAPLLLPQVLQTEDDVSDKGPVGIEEKEVKQKTAEKDRNDHDSSSSSANVGGSNDCHVPSPVSNESEEYVSATSDVLTPSPCENDEPSLPSKSNGENAPPRPSPSPDIVVTPSKKRPVHVEESTATLVSAAVLASKPIAASTQSAIPHAAAVGTETKTAQLKAKVQTPPSSSNPSPLSHRRLVGTLPAKLSYSDVPVVASESSEDGDASDSEAEMETQLKLMRSHLRHSRRRYSMRVRRPERGGGGGEGARERVGDQSVGTLDPEFPLQRSATISGAQRAYLKGRYSKKTQGDEGPGGESSTLTKNVLLSRSQFLEPRVDKHGRSYVMDHKDKTIAYKDEDSQSDLAKRRKQLDRRYLSLKRMKGRPDSLSALSPTHDTAPNVPITAGNAVLLSPEEQEETTPPAPAEPRPLASEEQRGSQHREEEEEEEGLEPRGRLRTNTNITDKDRQAKATVLAKFKHSQRHTTLNDPRRKKSDSLLSVLKTASLRKMKRATSAEKEKETTPPPPPVLPEMAEEDRERDSGTLPREESPLRPTVAVAVAAVEMPGLQFITRKDLYTLINAAGPAAQKFLESRSLMELIQRIRTDPTLFLKYQHSPVIIDMCNLFADKSMELPAGWERKLNKDGKAFFVDHNTEKTTYIDPRLPLNGASLPESLLEALKKADLSLVQPPPSLNPRRVAGEHMPQSDLLDSDRRDSQSPPSTSQGSSNTSQGATDSERQASSTPESDIQGSDSSPPQQRLSYNEQVVEFLRQSNVFTTITGRYRRQLKPDLKTLIETIRSDGPSALEAQSEHPHMLELILILSMFEEDIANTQQPWVRANSTTEKLKAKREKKKKAFEQKLQNFRYTLNHLGYAQNNRFRFNMRRDHLLEDAYEHVMKSRIRHLQRKRLDIQFQGEEGLDYGGPSREFFFLVSREIFNPYYGIFEYSANDTYTVQISPTSFFIENNLDWFKFAGRIIGLAIAQGYLLDVFFTRPMYKSLLNSLPTLKDLEAIEPGIYSSLVWIQENDPEPLDLTFTVEEEVFGELVEHELKEGGGEIPVTQDNKVGYIDLMLRWRLDRGVQEQTTAFVSGFREIIPGSLVRQFDAQELEFVIAGVLEVDVDDWRENTDYRAGYHPDHPVIKMFWKAVESLDNEQKLRLLQFVTGTSSVPFEGFKALKGSSGPKKFNIELWGEPNSLPRSHTCFNRLDLPPYSAYEDLFDKMVIAIEEGGTFGIE